MFGGGECAVRDAGRHQSWARLRKPQPSGIRMGRCRGPKIPITCLSPEHGGTEQAPRYRRAGPRGTGSMREQAVAYSPPGMERLIRNSFPSIILQPLHRDRPAIRVGGWYVGSSRSAGCPGCPIAVRAAELPVALATGYLGCPAIRSHAPNVPCPAGRGDGRSTIPTAPPPHPSLHDRGSTGTGNEGKQHCEPPSAGTFPSSVICHPRPHLQLSALA